MKATITFDDVQKTLNPIIGIIVMGGKGGTYSKQISC
jgi:hypothetical protein